MVIEKMRIVSGLGAFALVVGVTVHAASTADIVGHVAAGGAGLADAVISIEGPVVAAPADAAVHTIDHRDLRFVPHVTVVPVGARIRFDNSDDMPCRIYCVSPTATFVRRQEATTITMDRPGIIEVRCADHPKLSAFIVVTTNPYFAISDNNGEYAIRSVPAGKYRLQVWREGVGTTARPIVVGATTLTMDIDQ